MQLESALHLINIWWKDNPTANRSGVPYINHVNEGLIIAKNLKITCPYTLSAYVLHPIVQNDKDVVNGIQFLIDNIGQYEIFYIMEYRKTANAYLPNDARWNESYNYPKLSPVKEVNDMLIIDKIQNYKDFKQYNSTLPHADILELYFNAWFNVLGISKEKYNNIAIKGI